MEAQLIEAVLSGRLSVQAALAWALGDGEEPPPIELRLGTPWRAASGPRPALRQADFRVRRRRRCRRCRLLALPALASRYQHHPLPLYDMQVAALNYVREQAELVLAAAEQEAAGAGGSSQPATPTPAPPPAGRAAAAAEGGGRTQPAEAPRATAGSGQPQAPHQVQQRRASWPSAGGQQAQHEQRLLEEAPTKETEAAAEAVERVWAELMADINWAGADQGQLWYIMRSVRGPGRYPSKVCAAAEQQLLRAFADTCSHLSKQLKDERRAAKESARLLVKADIRNAELEERVAQWQDHAQQYGAYEPRYGGGPLY